MRTFLNILVGVWLVILAHDSQAREFLFARALRDYDSRGLEGETYRREFETRLFSHNTWRQRLYYYSSEPDVNETLETYSKRDGSFWLSHRQASPSLTGIIYRRIVDGEKFDLKEKLDAIRVTTHDVALPSDVARELDLLWRTMLPGLTKPPVSRDLYTHVPMFIGLAREDHSIETGSVCLAAYNTPIYRMFVDVITDLRAVTDRATSATDPIFRRLPDKMRRLRARL